MESETPPGPTMKVEVWSDVACPWCWIGKARFERALDGFLDADAVEVVYRPFQLDPSAPAEAVPMMRYLEGRFGGGASAMVERVSEVAREQGLEMDYERGLAVNTLDAHRLLEWLRREHGSRAQGRAATALFEAHFSEGRDIADPDVLADVAEAAGAERERARAYLASDAGADRVREALAEARRLGITAVPTFVFEDRWAVQGAQSAETFLKALETVAEETRAGADRP